MSSVAGLIHLLLCCPVVFRRADAKLSNTADNMQKINGQLAWRMPSRYHQVGLYEEFDIAMKRAIASVANLDNPGFVMLDPVLVSGDHRLVTFVDCNRSFHIVLPHGEDADSSAATTILNLLNNESASAHDVFNVHLSSVGLRLRIHAVTFTAHMAARTLPAEEKMKPPQFSLTLIVALAIGTLLLGCCSAAGYIACTRLEVERRITSNAQAVDPCECTSPVRKKDESGQVAKASGARQWKEDAFYGRNVSDSEHIFANMNMLEIVAAGCTEHWMIKAKQISILAESGIQSGAFGTVYRGLMMRSTDVAIKCPSNVQSLMAQKCDRSLANEIRILRRVRHPNCVLFHGATVLEGPCIALVLEWCGGGNLYVYIYDRHCKGVLADDKHIERLLTDVSRGMLYLHSQCPPILHRDLKPQNILIEQGEPPRAKVADFGLGLLLNFEEYRGCSGTKGWIAPEVVAGKCFNESSDVFSFGCVLLFCVIGKVTDTSVVKLRAMSMLESDAVHRRTLRTACGCLQEEPERRTDFLSIYQLLTAPVEAVEAQVVGKDFMAL